MWRERPSVQVETNLAGHPITLTQIAPTAAGDDVVPGVGTAPGARGNVVKAIGSVPAVLASLTIAAEYSASGYGNGALERNPHKAGQPDHRRNRDHRGR
jgi:hypothetical protein